MWRVKPAIKSTQHLFPVSQRKEISQRAPFIKDSGLLDKNTHKNMLNKKNISFFN
jgi:hypothetical protein